MEIEDLDRWEQSLRSFHARFAHLFARSESREQAAKYLRALLSPVERKNGWQMAEVLGDARPDAMERLLYRAPWDAEAARDILERFLIETFGEDEAVAIVDETGFLKKGEKSVGVQRQYTGTAGKVENSQVGVFLGYASARGHVLLDRRLYLPRSWADDAPRRKAAKVPEEVAFESKVALALAMLEHARELGVPMRWVTADKVYGGCDEFRARVQALSVRYVLAVPGACRLWRKRPALKEVVPRASRRRGRPLKRVRLAAGAQAPRTAAQVVAQWPAQRWRRLSVGQGEKGPLLDEWAAGRVIESRGRLPGPWVTLLARRTLSEPRELTYYLCLAPAATALEELATVAASRFRIEQCIEEAKGEAGLDHYEVRHWPSWHRHVTLSMMALAFLASMRSQSEGEKRCAAGRSDGRRSAPPAGDRPASARPQPRLSPGLVLLASQPPPASAPKLLPNPSAQKRARAL